MTNISVFMCIYKSSVSIWSNYHSKKGFSRTMQFSVKKCAQSIKIIHIPSALVITITVLQAVTSFWKKSKVTKEVPSKILAPFCNNCIEVSWVILNLLEKFIMFFHIFINLQCLFLSTPQSKESLNPKEYIIYTFIQLLTFYRNRSKTRFPNCIFLFLRHKNIKIFFSP